MHATPESGSLLCVFVPLTPLRCLHRAVDLFGNNSLTLFGFKTDANLYVLQVQATDTDGSAGVSTTAEPNSSASGAPQLPPAGL